MWKEHLVMMRLEKMTSKDFRKELGQRIKRLRKESKLTQKELGAQVGVSFNMLNKYEGGFNCPPADLLVKLAQALGVSVDYLLTGKKLDLPVSDTRILEKIRLVEKFSVEDQETVLRIIEAMAFQVNVQGMIPPRRAG